MRPRSIQDARSNIYKQAQTLSTKPLVHWFTKKLNYVRSEKPRLLTRKGNLSRVGYEPTHWRRGTPDPAILCSVTDSRYRIGDLKAKSGNAVHNPHVPPMSPVHLKPVGSACR